MPDFTRADLRQELYDHGHHYLENEANRANIFIQEGVEDLVNEMSWPFREIELEVIPGSVIDQMGTMQNAWLKSDGQVLYPARRDTLRDASGDLTTKGRPRWYYREGQQKILVYPDTTDSIGLYLFSRYCWIKSSNGQPALEAEADADKPVVPAEYRSLIVTAAQIRAYRDVSDFGEAAAIRTSVYEPELQRMQEALIRPNEDETQFQRMSSWY